VSTETDQPRAAGEAEAIEEQELMLRQMLGAEDEFLVDLVQAGMDAADFIKSRTGIGLLQDLTQSMKGALAVLRDPSKDEKSTLDAAYQLRVAYAAADSIASTIIAGRRAERRIDERE
jgi:hypothetical protein